MANWSVHYTLLTQLIHNGILIPPRPPALGLALLIRHRLTALTPAQEEMAMAWARKFGTVYVEDTVFVANFMGDWSAALGIDPPLLADEVDFGPALDLVAAERAAKAALTREERSAAAAERKAQRLALQERFGHATVNGERVQLATYMTEPSSIFMGRGEHPLRGRWKAGATQRDVTLNLSPDAPRPAGEWAQIIWEPECLWVARWEDKLSGKLKYIWLSDAAPIKQEREALKFDQGTELGLNLDLIRARFRQDLSSSDPKVRMVATACYLIDALCLRVGDEKDPDEADTVGATTLRPEHVRLDRNGMAEFRFLGKDSVLWHKKIELPAAVRDNLAALIENARPSDPDGKHPTRDLPQIFPDISSRNVNSYLSQMLPGLSAKVFRTHHATQAVRQSLATSKVIAGDPEHTKREAAARANLAAAELCNHTKQVSTNWANRKRAMRENRQRAAARVDQIRQQLEEARADLERLNAEAQEHLAAAGEKELPNLRSRYRLKRERSRRRVDAAREKLRRARLALGRVESRNRLAADTRIWNLGTSLKSYIDPRVYHRWGRTVDFDVLHQYYPKALHRKYAWVSAAVEREDSGPTGEIGPEE